MSLSIRKTKRETPIRIKIRWNNLLEMNRVNQSTCQGKKLRLRLRKRLRLRLRLRKKTTLPFKEC